MFFSITEAWPDRLRAWPLRVLACWPMRSVSCEYMQCNNTHGQQQVHGHMEGGQKASAIGEEQLCSRWRAVDSSTEPARVDLVEYPDWIRISVYTRRVSVCARV
jgi:hypothetical protein